jgi:hypothetical protein
VNVGSAEVRVKVLALLVMEVVKWLALRVKARVPTGLVKLAQVAREGDIKPVLVVKVQENIDANHVMGKVT